MMLNELLYSSADVVMPITPFDLPLILSIAILMLFFVVIPAIVFIIIFINLNKKKKVSANNTTNDPS